MINKNTVIAQMMNMLNINDDKEIIGYITSVIYDDKEVRFLVDGEDTDIICLYLALTGILADKQNLNIHDFLEKVDVALSQIVVMLLKKIVMIIHAFGMKIVEKLLKIKKAMNKFMTFN